MLKHYNVIVILYVLCYHEHMTITTTQKVIKIGTSRGVILPAKELKRLNVQDDDELEIIVRKKEPVASNEEVLATAESIMRRYGETFKNLANR